MNPHDRANLEFLLSLETTKDWEQWAENVDQDDLIYAMELLKTAQAEAEVERIEIQEAIYEEEGLDLTLANQFINRVKEKL